MNPEVYLTQDELQRLASLTRDPNWSVLVRYFDAVRAAAQKSLRNRKNSLQDYGYWAGVIQIIDDVENLPVDVTKIIYPQKDAGHEE
jgi:hypothetical protein